MIFFFFFGKNSIFPASTFGVCGENYFPCVRSKRVRPAGLSGSTRKFDRSEPYGNIRNERLNKKKALMENVNAIVIVITVQQALFTLPGRGGRVVVK